MFILKKRRRSCREVTPSKITALKTKRRLYKVHFALNGLPEVGEESLVPNVKAVNANIVFSLSDIKQFGGKAGELSMTSVITLKLKKWRFSEETDTLSQKELGSRKNRELFANSKLQRLNK